MKESDIDRNAEILRFHKQGYSNRKLATFFDISAERISQIVSNDNFDIKNIQKRELTTRETEIIELASEGLTDIEIGLKLKISHRTVQTYMQRVIIKLDAVNKINAVSIYSKKYPRNMRRENANV